MTKLSPQKEIIVSTLRDRQWHCGREWLNRIKDDRKRISELNETYMKERGYEIKGEPCRGHTCGVRDCPLFARRAVSLNAPQSHLNVHTATHALKETYPSSKNLREAAQRVRLFDQGKSALEIFA